MKSTIHAIQRDQQPAPEAAKPLPELLAEVLTHPDLPEDLERVLLDHLADRLGRLNLESAEVIKLLLT